MSVRNDYDAGVDYLELPSKLKWWQRIGLSAFLGMTPRPFDLIALGITHERIRSGEQSGDDLIRFAFLSRAEKDAVSFMHQILLNGSTFLYDLIDEDGKNMRVFEAGLIFESACDLKSPIGRHRAKQLLGLSGNAQGQVDRAVHNPALAGGEIVRLFVTAFPDTPIAPMQ